ncbi:MAG: hypothetical protein R3E96_07455 [Planctomycetota bacterium]
MVFDASFPTARTAHIGCIVDSVREVKSSCPRDQGALPKVGGSAASSRASPNRTSGTLVSILDIDYLVPMLEQPDTPCSRWTRTAIYSSE